MKIELLADSQPNKLQAIVRDADEHFLNALRRAVNSDIPSFAIDEIAFYENTSPLFNEYVANRVALVPLTFEEGVAPGTVFSFSLEAEAADAARVVYSREIQSSDPVIKVFCERIPIMKLGKGQKLKFEATAVLGSSARHAKFQSALASYGALPDFRVSSKCDKCGKCVAACPAKIISPQIKLSAPEKCVLCENCAETCPKTAVTVRPKPGEFVLFVESFNNLTAREQLERALRLIDERLEFVETGVKNPKKLEKIEEEARAAAEAAAQAAAEAAAKAEEEARAASEKAGGVEAEKNAESPAEPGVETGVEVELVEQTAKEKKERKRKAKKAEKAEKEAKEKN